MAEINGQTAIYGIIGNPIGHTLSPMIHNGISEALKINAVYVPFAVNDDLSCVVNGLYSLGVKGINVTVPYKRGIIDKLCGADSMALKIGAVNTLKLTPDGYYGYNTDILGLDRELEDEGIGLKGRDVIILGAGGAARAAAFLCASKSPASITMINRTPEKAQAIMDDVTAYAQENGIYLPGSAADIITIEEAGRLQGNGYIVFQCTNVGLAPKDNECVIDDMRFYDKVSTGVDLIYRPAKTMFMKHVETAGGAAYNGLKMLIYQAVCAYEIWHDIKVPREVIPKIEKMLNDSLKEG